MRRGRNPGGSPGGHGQGNSAHSSCINKVIETLEYFASLRERSRAIGAQVTAFSHARGALTPAEWKAAVGSHGRLIVSLVGAHGWAARALELDYGRVDALDVLTETRLLLVTLVNLMQTEERELLALAFIRADTLSLYARLLARVARGSADGDGSNGSGGSSRGSGGSGGSSGSGGGSGGSVTGRGATCAAMAATQPAAVNIRAQLTILSAAPSMLHMLLSCRGAFVELRAALLRTQLFEHISAALLSAAAAIVAGASANMDANWGSLLTCASNVGSCINSLVNGMAQEEDCRKQETPQWQPETVGGGEPAPQLFLTQVTELEVVRRLLGGRCLQACAVWMTRVVEATLREGSATGSTAAAGQVAAQDRAAQALGSGHGAAGPAAAAGAAAAAAAAATGAAPAAGGGRAPPRWRSEAAGDAVAVCRALVRPAVPLTLVTQNTYTYIVPAAYALAISARDCPFRLALTPPLRWGAKRQVADTGAGAGSGAQEQQQQGPCAPDATAGTAATGPAAGAAAAAVAASARLRSPSRSAGPEAVAVERTCAVNTYDALFGAVDAMCAGRNANMGLQDEQEVESMRLLVPLLVRLLCKLRPRQAAARLAGLWRVLLCELRGTRFTYVAAEVGLLLRLQLEEGPRSSTTAVAPASASPAVYAAPAAVAVAPHPAKQAFTPSLSLRCALAAGLLPRLEALLRQQQASPEAFAQGGSSHRLLWPLLVDSGVWPLVLAHAPAAQVASLVATLTAAVRRLRHGHLSQVAAAEGRSSGRTSAGSSIRGGDATGSSTSGNGGASRSAASAPGTHAAGADGSEACAGICGKGLVELAVRLSALLGQSMHAWTPISKVYAPDGGALEATGLQAQALEQGQLPQQEQAQEPKTAAVGAAGGLCLQPSAYSPVAEQQRLLMSLCAWQWLPQVLCIARDGSGQYAQDAAARQLSIAVINALRAQRHAAGAASGLADGNSPSFGGSSGTFDSSGSSGCCVVSAAQTAESWRAFLHSQELDAEGFLAVLLRHIGNPSRRNDSLSMALLLGIMGAWDPEMLVRAAIAAAADGGSSSSGSSGSSAAAVVAGARMFVEDMQRKDDRWFRWPLQEVFDYMAAAVEQPSPAPGAGGVGTERPAAEGLQPNGRRELQAMITASYAAVATGDILMPPAEVQARLRRLPVPAAMVIAGNATTGSSTTGAAAAAAVTVETGSERGLVLCGNPACANTDGPSALFPAGGGKTCARCKAVWYCCGACQLAHWQQQGGHREACSKAHAQGQGQGQEHAQGQGQAQAQAQAHWQQQGGYREACSKGQAQAQGQGGRPQL